MFRSAHGGAFFAHVQRQGVTKLVIRFSIWCFDLEEFNPAPALIVEQIGRAVITANPNSAGHHGVVVDRDRIAQAILALRINSDQLCVFGPSGTCLFEDIRGPRMNLS